MTKKKVINNQAHDSFVKKAMSNPKVAKEFFDFHLPEHVKNLVNLDTLKLQKDSFLDNILGQGTVDMLFEVQFDQDLGYLSLLVEHQSKPDYLMPFRIYKYMLRICDNHLKKYPRQKQLPLIYPIIFYSGQDKYTTPLDLWSLFADPELAKSFFVGPFQLIDLQKIPDEELRKRTWAGVMEFVIKRIFARDILPFIRIIAPLLENLGKQNLDYMETILCYIMEKAESEQVDEVVEIFKETLSGNAKVKAMTIAEQLIAKGKIEGKIEGIKEGIEKGKLEGLEKGIEKGKLEGLEKGIEKGKLEVAINMYAIGQDIGLIAKVTGLSQEELRKLLKCTSH